MSWSTWSAGNTPIPTALPAAPVQPTIVPTAINSAPNVMPPGIQYSPEQWAQAQQQNWQQWAQWQQQYQQWHQQYGAEYQKSINALQGLTAPQQPPLPSIPNTGVPPPLPEAKPPLPPEEPPINQSPYSVGPPKINQLGYSTAPPSYQKPPQASADSYASQRQPNQPWQSNQQQNLNKRPFSQTTEFEQNKRPLLERPKQWGNQQSNVNQWTSHPPPNFSQQPPPVSAAAKPAVEELSEAEKKFDKEFAAWEAQFNKWKDQNASHPDKTQYLEYEKKWESWRNSLLERREQMRKKRLAMSGTSVVGNKSAGLLPTPGSQNAPSIDVSHTGAVGFGVNKLPTEVPIKPQGTAPSTLDKSLIESNIPPHQNNEPLSFKPSIPSEDSSEGFLKPSFPTSGGIPGLDLVKDDEEKEPQEEEVIELDKEEKKTEPRSSLKGPDFDAISKGINTILGDQKLLNMLSMVSQNTPSVPPSNITTNTVSNIPRGFIQEHNFSAPPPPHQFTEMPPGGNFSTAPPTYQFNEGSHQNLLSNDQSNHSYDERSNHEENYQFRESVNNFDDQTRSSFTMGPNDQDIGYGVSNFPSRNQMSKMPPNRYGGVPPHIENERGLPIQPDNRSRFGPIRGNIGPGLPQKNDFGENNFNKGPNYQNENFNRINNRTDNYRNDMPPNDFNYGKNMNSRNNVRPNNFGGPNFDDQRGNGNLGKPVNFNEPRHADYRKNNYNQGDYEEYDNYNENDDYEKYHNMFTDDEQNGEFLRRNQNQGNGQQFGQMQPIPSLMDLPTDIPPELVKPIPKEDPIFEPTTIIDYEHKSLRTVEVDVVVEPLYMFDYRHKPLNRIPVPQRPKWLLEAVKFIREFDPLVPRVPLPFERPPIERYPLTSREIRRDDRRSEISEDRYASRRSYEDRFYEDRNKRFSEDIGSHRSDRRSVNRDENPTYFRRPFNKNDNHFEKDFKADAKRNHKVDNMQISNTDFEDFSDEEINFESNEVKKHQQNRENRVSSNSPILSNPPNPANVNEITLIEDIINPPGRFHRPPRIVIILRGPPGSGKTYLAKLIKDKEVENGGSAPRILSLDDYFMVEHEKDVVEDGKRIKVKEMIYEYEAEMEESYRSSFVKSFKKTITDGYFPFIIVDNVNDKVKYFGEMWSFAKQNGFQVYICQLDLDPVLCTKRNIHNRSQVEIEECIAGWEPTPSHHPTIDASGFFQMSIADVEMEEVFETEEEPKAEEEVPEDEVRSKWDTFDCSINNLAKLDGVSKPLRSSRTMEEYLQMENEWEPVQPTKPGQKRVRWADLEEQRQQQKMRAIGFIVGHTNWNRMLDPTEGSSALTHTKYI